MTTPDPNENPVEWRLVDTDLTTVLAVLPAATKSSLRLNLNEAGSGELKVPLLSDVAYLIESGQFVRCYYRGAIRGGFFVENIARSQVNAGEGGELWTSISGRGALSLFDRAKVWTDGTAESTRKFENMTKAEILITLITEAQGRGVLSEITYDFSATDDSNSDAWTDSESMQFSIGKSYLDVIREMAEMGYYFNITVETDGTFNLSAYPTYGTDKSETIYFRRGSNCIEVSNSEMGSEIGNALLIDYGDGYSYTSDATSIAARGRREVMIDAIDAMTSANALTYGNARLAFLKDPKTEQNVQVYDGIGTRVFIDYDLGDYITLDLSGVESSNRIRTIELSWNMTEKANVVTGLNSVVFENEIRQSNDIRKLFEMWRRANDGQEVRLPFWAAIGQLGVLATTGTAIYAMAVSAAGKLYVGGDFDKVAGKDVNNAAVYDINTGVWSLLGTGFNGVVRAIACDGTDVYFGGDFTTADGDAADYAAVWDETGETLTALTHGLSISQIHAIAIYNDYVYFGGYSGPGLGDLPAVIRYNSASPAWYTIPGFGAEFVTIRIYSLAVHGSGDLYIGGDEAETPTASIFKWDGSTLTGVGTVGGIQGVRALAIIGDKLFIGGDFTDVGGVANTENLGVWDIDLEEFQSIDGGGANGAVQAMHVVNGVDLYLGGAFTVVGVNDQAANRIAKWNAGSYELLGTGLNNTCYAITSYNGNIGAGGTFTTAGDKPIKYVGAYITDLSELVDYLETGSGATNGYVHPNHTGDVTSVADGAQTIANDVVTNAKLNNMAEGTIKARIAAGTGDPEDKTLADIAAALQGDLFGGQTADRVMISDASGDITTDSNLTFDAANDQLSLGVASPVTSNGGFMQSYEGVSVGHYLVTWGSTFASFVRGIFARGTKASPTAAQADDIEFRIRSSAHDGSTYPSSNVELRFLANQNQASGAHGSRLEVYTTPDDSTTLTKAFTVNADGNVNIESGKTYNINGTAHTHAGGSGDMVLADVQTVTGAKTFGSAGAVGKLLVAGTTSGAVTLDTSAVAGTAVVTIPAVTDTLVGKATTDTLTNKEIEAATVKTSLKPTTDDGAALGDSTHGFSDLFLASGGIINFEGTLVTIKHNTSFDIIEFNTDVRPTALSNLNLGGGTASWGSLGIKDGGTIKMGSSVGEPILTHSAGLVTLTNGNLVVPNLVVTTAVLPDAADGAALGTTALPFSDLHLAEGAVINWDNGDLTLTQASNDLTIGGGSLTAAIKPRVVTTTDDATAVIDLDATDRYHLTAIANATTISTTGTLVSGKARLIRLKDAGVAKGLTWDAAFRAVGTTLPTTTVAGKTHYIMCVDNTDDSKVDVLAAIVQA